MPQGIRLLFLWKKSGFINIDVKIPTLIYILLNFYENLGK